MPPASLRAFSVRSFARSFKGYSGRPAPPRHLACITRIRLPVARGALMSGLILPVERATALVPELSMQPEWISQQAWYATNAFDFSEMDASVLCHQIVGPYLRRSLVGGDQDPATRVLLFLEELLSQQDLGGRLAGRHTLEWSVFRRKLDQVAEPLMGAHSRQVIETLRVT